MRITLLAFLLLSLLLQQSRSQQLKLSIDAGGSTSNSPYSYQTFFGPVTERGQYVFGTNVSYPFFGKGFGLFVETTNRVMNKSFISFHSNNVISGVCWRQPLSSAEVEFLAGFGYSWDKYKLNDPGYDPFIISNEMSVIHVGITLYIPATDFADIMLAGRVIQNNSSHSKANFFMAGNNLYIPPVLYSGMAGISFNLFDKQE